jgi:hypothetical protein
MAATVVSDITVKKLTEGWFGDWEVCTGDVRVLVRTVDIYTYVCAMCHPLADESESSSDDEPVSMWQRCMHEDAVHSFVIADTDAFVERMRNKNK